MEEFLPKPDDLLPLLPGAGTALFILLVALFVARPDKRRWAAMLAAFAIPAAFLATWWELFQEWPFEPIGSSQRGLWLILLGLAVGLIPNFIRKRRGVAIALNAATIAVVAYYLLRPFIEQDSEYQITTSTLLMFIGGITIAWAFFSELCRFESSRLMPFALGLVMVSAAQIFVFYGVASLSQLLATPGMALLAFAPFALFRDPKMVLGALLPTAVVTLSVLTLDAYYFGDPPPPAKGLIILCASPLLTVLEPLLAKAKLKIWLRRAIIMAALIGVAGWVVKTSFDARPIEPEDPYADMYEEYK